ALFQNRSVLTESSRVDDAYQRGLCGAGFGGPGRRRAGFGTGGAGAVLRRAQPSTFCREARPFIRSPDPPAAAATRDHVAAERGTLCNRGAASIADEWWSTIIQFPPSFTKVKLYRAGNVFVSPSFTYENV